MKINESVLNHISRVLWTYGATLDDLREALAPRWIKCSEGLPDDAGAYAIWVLPGKWRKGYWTGIRWVDHRGRDIDGVVAWAKMGEFGE